MDREDALRMEVRRFVTHCGTVRKLPASVHIGVLAGERVTLPADPSYDAGLRADLLTRALDRPVTGTERTSVWLTRSGHLTAGDVDLAWFAAARAAFGRYGVEQPTVHVITRYGWLDLRSGECRTWRRVRPLPRAS
jgi:hypothetical protein